MGILLFELFVTSIDFCNYLWYNKIRSGKQEGKSYANVNR